jgi:hypothetical protein
MERAVTQRNALIKLNYFNWRTKSVTYEWYSTRAEHTLIHFVRTLAAYCSKWPPALAVHERVRFKIARVVFRMLSCLFRMRAAPSTMSLKSSSRVCYFSWYTKSVSPQVETKECEVWRTGWPGMRTSTTNPTIFNTTDSSTEWLVDRNEVDGSRVAATYLIWLGQKHLPKAVVASPEGNSGNSMLLNVPQEGMAH